MWVTRNKVDTYSITNCLSLIYMCPLVPTPPPRMHAYSPGLATFEHFNFAQNCKYAKPKLPKDIITWDDMPHSGYSADSVHLIIYFPSLTKGPATSSVFQWGTLPHWLHYIYIQ